MYFIFKCPHCTSSLKIRQDLAGKKKTCPYCQTSILIPEPTHFQDEKSAEWRSLNTASPRLTPFENDHQSFSGSPIQIAAREGESSDPSDVNLLLTSQIGFVSAILFMGLMFPIKSTYLGNLFVGGGVQGIAIQFFSSVMFFWAIAILIFKHRKLKRQKSYMLLDVLPTEISEEITLGKLRLFADHIHDLPGDHSESYLITRVVRGLEYFRVRRNAAETVTMMSSQSEIDFNNVGMSYMPLKVLIWAIPIMGFVGTVLGISMAVGSLSGALSGSEDMSALKDSLQSLFSGLGTAFDTTLVALLMSMLIKFPMSSLQKSEDRLLNWVEEYCNENLLRRLKDDRVKDVSVRSHLEPDILRNVVEEALVRQHGELEAWHHKLEGIGKVISAEVAKGWDEINQKMIDSRSEWSDQIFKQMGNYAVEINDKNQADKVDLGQRLEAMQNLSDRLEASFSGMERGLTSLSKVLQQLGDEKIIVQQVERSRRSWFEIIKQKPRPKSEPAVVE